MELIQYIQPTDIAALTMAILTQWTGSDYQHTQSGFGMQPESC